MTELSWPVHVPVIRFGFTDRAPGRASGAKHTDKHKAKHTMKPSNLILSLTAASLLAGCASERQGEEKEESVSLAQCPPAVRQAITQYAAGSEIKKVEKGDVDGQMAYEFDLEKGGKTSEVTLLPDGQLLSTEEPVTQAEIPAAVWSTIQQQAADGKLVSMEKAVEKGKTVYEAVLEKGGKKREITVSPEGRVEGTEAVKD